MRIILASFLIFLFSCNKEELDYINLTYKKDAGNIVVYIDSSNNISLLEFGYIEYENTHFERLSFPIECCVKSKVILIDQIDIGSIYYAGFAVTDEKGNYKEFLYEN